MAGRRFIFRQGQGDRGATVVLIALLLPLLIGLLGLAVDFGMLFMHHSRLQHAADAMALAGVRVNSTAKAAQLLSLSDADETEDGLSFRREERNYRLAASKTPSTAEDRKAGDMMKRDTSPEDQANGVGFVSRLFDGDGAKAYKVTLTENFATHFLKVFGVNQYPVEVQALAVALPGSTKEGVLTVAKAVFEVSPNYYWEDLGWNTVGTKFKNMNPTISYADLTINADNPETFTITSAPVPKEHRNVYSSKFFTIPKEHFGDFFVTPIPLSEVTDGEVIVSYKDRETVQGQSPSSEPKEEYRFSAAPIMGAFDTKIYSNSKIKTEADLRADFNDLRCLDWKFNSSFFNKVMSSRLSDSDKLQAIFVDRPTINHELYTPDGQKYNGWSVRATSLTITSDNPGTWVASPLHVRIESEPVRIGGDTAYRAVTVVQPITINVKGKNPIPMIIAYEGPSRLRGEKKLQDTKIMEDIPIVNPYKPTEIQAPTKYFLDDNGSPKSTKAYLQLTSVTESPPVTVNLEQDFRGVIYAPFSKVIVKGSGKIEGFILAHELAFVGSSDSGRTRETLKDYVLPVLMPVRVDGSENRVWNYETISDPPRDYQIVYNSFKTYTDSQ